MSKAMRFFGKVAMTILPPVLLTGCGFLFQKYGSFPEPDQIKGVIANTMQQDGVTAGCVLARHQLFFPATSAAEGAVNRRILSDYFATKICAPKGEVTSLGASPQQGYDAAWRLAENNSFRTRTPTREDIFRIDFMRGDFTSPNPPCPARNPYDTNQYGYSPQQGAQIECLTAQ